MGSFGVIAIILIVLVGCVLAITIIQKREEQKAAIRQKASQYRYRANQASSILGNFTNHPIGPEARVTLLRYSLANLNAIKKLTPADANVSKSIEKVNEAIKNPNSAADNQRLNIPDDFQQLSHLVNQLSTLAKFLLKINKMNVVPPNIVSAAVKRIMGLISESKICAHIQQGKEQLSKHEYVPAQRNFILAQQMLLKIVDKDTRLQKLEAELKELVKGSAANAINTQLSFNDTAEDGEANDESEGSLFGPRKKW